MGMSGSLNFQAGGNDDWQVDLLGGNKYIKCHRSISAPRVPPREGEGQRGENEGTIEELTLIKMTSISVSLHPNVQEHSRGHLQITITLDARHLHVQDNLFRPCIR